jgi:3-methyladenine DNA glycosylase AlkD
MHVDNVWEHSMSDVDDAIAALKQMATKKTRDGMSRFGIPSTHAFGVKVGDIRKFAKKLGRDHQLAQDLWKSGHYEARLLACFVGDSKKLTLAEMRRWAKQFDSWAICDTACFALFDRSPHAWKLIDEWATKTAEFEKRSAFAMLASLSVHDKKADDLEFADRLPLIESAASDERNFVKKAVSWALRSIGKRNPAMHALALAVAEQLARSTDANKRWVGKDAVRDLNTSATKNRMKRKLKKGS